MSDTFFQPDPNAVRASRHTEESKDGMLQRGKDCSAMLPYWDKVDALIDGVHALRAEGETYLPKFADEEHNSYQSRLKFTKFTNVYNDIVEGLAAKPFESEVEFAEDENKTVPDELLQLIEDIDGSGNNLTVFSANTFFNGINSAIDWIFVDAPPLDPNVRNRADQKAAGIRPYWSHVLGRNIIDINSKMIGGTEVLTYIKIFEPGNPDHIREFRRSDAGIVTWELFEKRDNARIMDNGKATFFYPVKDGIVTIGAIPLVPFITAKRDGRSWRFFPAMRSAADLAVELYQQESGLKWSKVLSAYPMLAGNGMKPPMGPDGKTPLKVAVGPGNVLWGLPDNNGGHGSWEYVQPDAGILKFLAEDIDDTIKQLRELGRLPLTAQSNLTVINSAAAAGKSRSAVKSWAYQLKDALENAMVLTCLFMGIKPETYDPTISVFTEFDEWTEGKDLETLDADRDRGDISRETLLEEKKRRGVYGAEFTIKREAERLLKEVPIDTAPDRQEDEE